jgi:hypothetical protein
MSSEKYTCFLILFCPRLKLLYQAFMTDHFHKHSHIYELNHEIWGKKKTCKNWAMKYGVLKMNLCTDMIQWMLI